MVRSGGGSNLNPTPVEVRSRLRLLTLLFAIQRGVRTLSRDGSSEPAAEAAAREEVDSDCPAQLQALEDERLSGQDGEVAADLRELVPSQHQPALRSPPPRWPPPPARTPPRWPPPPASLARTRSLLSSKNFWPPFQQLPSALLLDRPAGVTWRRVSPPVTAPWRMSPASWRVSGQLTTAMSTWHPPKTSRWRHSGHLKSEGGLTVPTAVFLDIFLQMEMVFCVHHALEPEGLRLGINAELG